MKATIEEILKLRDECLSINARYAVLKPVRDDLTGESRMLCPFTKDNYPSLKLHHFEPYCRFRDNSICNFKREDKK